MDSNLAAYLARWRPGASEDVVWGDRLRLRQSAYLGNAMPPAAYTTSARAVVLRDGSVLVTEDQDGHRHVLPGGRLEPGEEPEAAMRREVAEESGWLVGEAALLGFLYFRHLDPKPSGYRYPYPIFLQAVFVAEATGHEPERMIEDDYVVGATFVPLTEAREIPLRAADRLFLDAAWRRR